MRRRTGPGASGGRAGQGVVEYGLTLAGIALVAAILLLVFPDTVALALELIARAIARATR